MCGGDSPPDPCPKDTVLIIEASEIPLEKFRGVEFGVAELDCSGELDISLEDSIAFLCGQEKQWKTGCLK